MKRTTRRLLVAAAAASLLGASLIVPRPQTGAALDPRSPGPGGTKAVFDTFRELGHDVQLDTIEGADTIVLFQDELTDERRAEVQRHVEAGARLVLADPFSPMANAVVVGQAATDTIGATRRPPDCGWAELSEVEAVSSGRWLALQPAEGAAPVGLEACFPVGDGHGLLRYELGAGEVVVLSVPGALTNLRLADADNALLASALLARTPTSTIAVVPRPAPGEGTATLGDLISDRVWWALAIAVLLFLTVAWERGRRLGTPVDEALAVRVPGSELVHAIGSLLQRSEAHEAAARALRRSARRDLGATVGLPADAPTDLLAARVSAGRDLDPGAIENLLTSPVESADDLLTVQSGLARVRATVRQTPTSHPSVHEDTPTGEQL